MINDNFPDKKRIHDYLENQVDLLHYIYDLHHSSS